MKGFFPPSIPPPLVPPDAKVMLEATGCFTDPGKVACF